MSAPAPTIPTGGTYPSAPPRPQQAPRPAPRPALQRALLSAHKAACAQTGHTPNTLDALHASIALAEAGLVDYIEIDVHRTLDGHLVIQHDRTINHAGTSHDFTRLTLAEATGYLGRNLTTYETALTLFAAHHVKAHLDFKFTSPTHLYRRPNATYEAQAAHTALAILGPGRFILTTMEDASVAAMRTWADQAAPDTLIGLSLGRDLTTLNPWQQIRLRASELFPAHRVRACGANLLVTQHVLADTRLLAWAHRHRLPVLVWTVDNARALNRYLADPRVWMVTTNHPARAHA